MVTMLADFSDESHAALMRGDAIDSNGFRSKKGSFYPDQPAYRSKPTVKEELQQYGVNLAVDAAYYLTFEILCPAIKCFASEKVYPALVQEWDDWLERRAERKAEQNKTPATRSLADERRDVNHKGNVINLCDYRKGA